MPKNVTLSADEALIKKARAKALREHTTLNAEFRQWLERYVTQDRVLVNYEELMAELSYAKPGRKLSRDEMNER